LKKKEGRDNILTIIGTSDRR